MYKSPIELYMEEMGIAVVEKLDAMVFDAVAGVGVTVDKEELLQALRYDRDQYDKGFVDGKAAAMDALVRCKDCKHWNNACCGLGTGDCHVLERLTFETFFCAYGERRSE